MLEEREECFLNELLKTLPLESDESHKPVSEINDSLARAATSGSWVTNNTVLPSLMRRSKPSITSLA